MEIKHQGTQKLETTNFILRRFTVGDAKTMYKNWANNEEIIRYLSWGIYKSVPILQNTIFRWIVEYPRVDYYKWGVFLKELPEESIGMIYSLEVTDKSVELEYCIGWREDLLVPAQDSASIADSTSTVNSASTEESRDSSDTLAGLSNFDDSKIKECGELRELRELNTKTAESAVGSPSLGWLNRDSVLLEILQEISRFFTEEVGIQELVIKMDARAESPQKVLEQAGFELRGVQKEAVKRKGEMIDLEEFMKELL